LYVFILFNLYASLLVRLRVDLHAYFFVSKNHTLTNLMLTCMTDTPYPKFTVYVFVPVMGEDTSIIGMLFKISIIGMQHNGNAM